MKIKLLESLRHLPELIWKLVRVHPIEMILLLIGCSGAIFVYEYDAAFDYTDQLLLVPIFALLALALNQATVRGAWRLLYYLCWLPMVAMWFWAGLEVWINGWQYPILVAIMAPLCVAAACRYLDNERFISNVLVWMRSIFLSLLFVNLTLGLFCALLYSVAYIFRFEGSWIDTTAMYALIFAQTLVVPMLVMGHYDHRSEELIKPNRIFDILLNYILTPALLAYAGVLYLYAAKILVTWSLPRGGVAYMVCCFMMLAVITRALQFLVTKPIFSSIYGRMSLAALPIVLLFWVGVVHRLCEYGLTEDRVWLVVSGLFMTTCAVFFLWQRVGRYLYIALAALVLVGALVFVPALSPKSLSICSQRDRAERFAGQLGIIGIIVADGKMNFEAVSQLDTTHRVQLRSLYGSLKYLDRKGASVFGAEKFDLDDFSKYIPEQMRDYVCYGRMEGDFENGHQAENSILYLTVHETSELDIAGYEKLYKNVSKSESPCYDYTDGELKIQFGDKRPDFKISGSQLLSEQLTRYDAPSVYPSRMWFESSQDKLMQYKNDSLFIVFSTLRIERKDSVLLLDGLSIDMILTR